MQAQMQAFSVLLLLDIALLKLIWRLHFLRLHEFGEIQYRQESESDA